MNFRFLPFSFFISLIVFTQTAVAQHGGGSIEGKVITADGNPAYVTIELKKFKKITVTNNAGEFTLTNLPALNDTIRISSVGSQATELAISLEKNGTVNLGTIQLAYTIGQLQEVEVRGRTIQSYKSDYTFLSTKTQTAFKDVPQSVSTITKEMISDRMEFTLKEAADEAAGVNHCSGYDDYTIRGFKAENARLINGLRGYNTTYTSAMLVNVERIEVVKGPSATLYGNCDPGGTINLVTKKPLATNEAELNFSGGTWNHFRAQGDITGPVNKSNTLLYRFNAGYDNTGSYRDELYAKSYEIAPSLSFIPNNKIQVNIDFSLSHINTILDRGQPGFQNDFSLKSTPISLIASQPGDYLHETDIATNVLFAYKINDHISFNSGYLNYHTQQDNNEHGVKSYITNDSVNLFFNKWNYQTSTNTLSEYFIFRFNTGKLKHQLLAGYDYISSSVNLQQNYYEQPDLFGAGSGIAGTFSLKNPRYAARPVNQYQLSTYQADATNVEASIYQTQGIYVQEQISLEKWKFLFGLRQDMYEAGDDDDAADTSGNDEVNALLPRIGIVYDLRPNVSLYATYNKGFDPFEASTSTQVFNAPYKPVNSILYEVGAKANYFNNRLTASVSLYQLTLQNVAVNANDIANPNLYVQQGTHRSRGIETEVNGNILPNLSIAASWAYSVAKVIKSVIKSQEGTIVDNAPKNTTNTWIKYNFTKGVLKGFGLAAGHSQESVRNSLTQGFTLPGYFVLNAGIRYNYKHFTTAINLNNITNTTYWIGAYNQVNKWPGMPRNFMMNVGYKF